MEKVTEGRAELGSVVGKLPGDVNARYEYFAVWKERLDLASSDGPCVLTAHS